MKIYGVAFLAACLLVGKYLGSLLGSVIGVNGDVGGVGFAMLILMIGNHFFSQKWGMQPKTKEGIAFWSAMYIPIIIAMASIQNVKAAFSGGWVAILAGTLTTLLVMTLVPFLSKIGISEVSDEIDATNE